MFYVVEWYQDLNVLIHLNLNYDTTIIFCIYVNLLILFVFARRIVTMNIMYYVQSLTQDCNHHMIQQRNHYTKCIRKQWKR